MSSVPRKSREAKRGPDPGTPEVSPPVVSVRRYVLFAAIAAVGCALDLLSKHWIFQWRGAPRANNIWWIWDGYVGIETAINTGALFGLGQGRVTLLAAVSVAAVFGILYWLFVSGAVNDLFLTTALGCILGGILGNLYDRLGIWGSAGVRDWILLCYGDHTWPNFNIADSLLVCGAGMLIWHGFRSGKHDLV